MEKYSVKLTPEERDDLLSLIKTGKAAAATLTHARILLAADENGVSSAKTDEEIAEMLHVAKKTVKNVRKKCVLDGIAKALNRKAYTTRKTPRKIGGTEEAHLVAICCSEPPEGQCRWTLNLLSDRLVELQIVDTVSRSTIHRTLKKMS